jgi:hypothetical protein
MKSAIAHLAGTAPYSQSRYYSEIEVPKEDNGKESSEAYERRTWRNRLHRTPDGLVQIPGQAFANSVKQAAKHLRIRVPGKGQSEYTKHFEAGIMVPDNLILPVKADEVPYDELFVPSNGVRGSGKRVTKLFPRIDEWEGEVLFYIFDDVIPEHIFRQVLVASGQLVGIGRFRPQSWGYYGRFIVKELEWRNEKATVAAMDMERSA